MYSQTKPWVFASFLVIWITACEAEPEEWGLGAGEQRHVLSGEAEGEELTYEAPDDALDSDIALVSAEKGLPTESVRSSILFHKAFSNYYDVLEKRFGDQISSAWVEPVPSRKGYIRFIGLAPREAYAVVETLEMGEIEILEDGVFTAEQQRLRAEVLVRALDRLGYHESAAGFRPSQGKIVIRVGVDPDDRDPTVEDVLSEYDKVLLVPELVSQAVDRVDKVSAEEIEMVVYKTTEPMFQFQHTRGGCWVGDSGVRLCTSAWSVSGPNGDAVLTAGHCSGLDEFYDPSLSAPYSMTYQNQVLGADGDAEYHTTTHVEYPEFYANSIVIRDVTATQSTGSMVGRTVCIYGRQSNVRSCDHEVFSITETINIGGVIVSNLAGTDNITTLGGDSGAGWSYDTTAWGVHSSVSSSLPESYFTPIRRVESRLGVAVKTN